MGIGFLSRRVIFVVPLVTVWLTSSPAAAPAMHTALISAAASDGCPAAEIVGVHGTSEGPSRTNGTDSPEIKATFAAFAGDERKLDEHGARLDYFAYPTVTFAEYLPGRWLSLRTTIHDYADQLEAELEAFSRSCPGTPILLVGYSLGALLIDRMLSSHRGERGFIDAVELYGDPCWYNPHGNYRGLARYAAAGNLRLGCFPEDAYPLVSPAGSPFVVQSRCISGDPICGQGWPVYEIGAQLIAAALCGLDKCPHLSYSVASASDGADFLAEHAFQQIGGDG
ncbi:MAG TPA: cutinase family protein [Streptosporangiaceae bacterium]|nr:cutinase family protein [Streptosporangiaceae bacterium]